MTLSILCVTNLEPHAQPFLQAMSDLGRELGAEVVFAWDVAGFDPAADEGSAIPACDVAIQVRSRGYIESVLGVAVEACSGDYILRLDDDERCSPAMVRWLRSGAWRAASAWTFATAGLWGDPESVLVMPELWPQYHVRLTTAALAGGQQRIHQPHPARDAVLAPAVIEHHKFLVKSIETRQAIAARYDAIRPGAGKRCHSVPELAYEELLVVPLGEGSRMLSDGANIRRVSMAAREVSA